MTNTLYLPELREMLAEHNAEELREFCSALHPAATAEFMEGLTPQEAWSVLEHADLPTRAAIFGYFPRDNQVEIIRRVAPAEIGPFIGHLPPDDRVDMLKQVEPELVERLLPLVPVKERRDILRLISYPEDTAGAIMTTEFAQASEQLTAREALEQIAREAGELETIYYVYVVDQQNHLRGVVSARQLVSAFGRPGVRVADAAGRGALLAGRQ